MTAPPFGAICSVLLHLFSLALRRYKLPRMPRGRAWRRCRGTTRAQNPRLQQRQLFCWVSHRPCTASCRPPLAWSTRHQLSARIDRIIYHQVHRAARRVSRCELRLERRCNVHPPGATPCRHRAHALATCPGHRPPAPSSWRRPAAAWLRSHARARAGPSGHACRHERKRGRGVAVHGKATSSSRPSSKRGPAAPLPMPSRISERRLRSWRV